MKIMGENTGQKQDAASPPQRSTSVGVPRAGIAPNRRGSCLSLGKDRLYQLGETELLVWDTATFALVARHPCLSPRGVVALPSGGAIALAGSDKPGFTAVVQLDADDHQPPQLHHLLTSCHPRALSRLFVLGSGERFAVISQNAQTAIDEIELHRERGPVRRSRFELTHDAFFTLTPLAETEAWLYASGSLFRKDASGEHLLHAPVALPLPVHVATLGTQAICALADGSLAKLSLHGDNIEWSRLTAESQQSPFLMSAGADKIAVAFISADYEIEIIVYHLSGRELLRKQVPWRVSLADADQQSMRISEGRLIVGDRQRLVAWDAESGKQLFLRS